MRVGYLGPEGSYSQLAAVKLCSGECFVEYATFYLLMKGLQNGDVDAIVMPIENTLNGSVTQNMDLLQYADGVLAVKECTVKIDHRLVTMPNAKLNEIKRVYSHPQALGQCARFLDRELTFATQIATRSTADSLKEIKSVYDAGIVGSHCDVGELVKTDYCISDLQTNYTQFLLLERVELAEPVHSNKVYFTAACRHEPGALWKLLSVLNEFNLNMTKIGSRPIKEQAWEYRFFIELEADFASLNVQKAIVEIKKMADFKLLGVY